MKIRIKKIHFIELLLALLPILRYFKIPGVNLNLGIICLLLIFAFSIFTFKFKNLFKRKEIILLLFCIYMLALYLLKSSLSSVGIGVLVYELLIYILIIINLTNSCKFDINKFFLYVRNISIIACFIIVTQYIFHFLLHSYFNLIPMNFYTEIIRNDPNAVRLISTGVIDGWFRPSAFFVEPSHFAQYCSVGLAYCMYSFYLIKGKKELLLAILLSITTLMSSSGIGFIVVFSLWIIFIIKYTFDTKTKKEFVFFLLGIIGLCILMYYLYQQTFVQLIITRLFATKQSGLSSIAGRNGGYLTFLNSSINLQVFGCGSGLEPDIGTEFYTTGSILLIRYGITGVLILVSSIISGLREDGLCIWIIFTVTLVIVSAGVHDFTNLAFYMVAICGKKSGIKYKIVNEQI